MSLKPRYLSQATDRMPPLCSKLCIALSFNVAADALWVGSYIKLGATLDSFISEIGVLGLSFKLRQISELISQGGRSFVDRSVPGILEPNWFIILLLLKKRGPQSVADMTKVTGLKHPTIIKVLKELEAYEVIDRKTDVQDKRQKIVSLSPVGDRALRLWEPVWSAFQKACENLLCESSPNLLKELLKLEEALRDKSFEERVREAASQQKREVA